MYTILDMALDVTAEVIAKQKLEEAEASLRGAVDLARLGTWSINVATNALTYSNRLIEWFGYDPRDIGYNFLLQKIKKISINKINGSFGKL